LIDLVYWQL